jgi:hypothetical protein
MYWPNPTAFTRDKKGVLEYLPKEEILNFNREDKPMDLFHIIDEAQAIIRQNGVFRQVKMYHRGTEVYVASGSGFAKMLGGNTTTVPNMSWIDYQANGVTPQPSGHRAGQPVWNGQYRCDKTVDIEEAIKDAPGGKKKK